MAETFNAGRSDVTYTGQFGDGLSVPSTARLTSAFTTDFDGWLTVAIDPVNNTILLRDSNLSPALSAAFAASDRVSTSGYEHLFVKSGAQASDSLLLFGNAILPAPAAAAPISLQYVSFLRWSHTDIATGITRVLHAVFGRQTPANKMPISGTSTYLTRLEAEDYHFGVGVIAKYNVSGSGSFSADFTAQRVSTETNRGSSVPTFSGTTPLESARRQRFAGNFTSTSPNFRGGSYSGAFFGPAAEEFGYGFFTQEDNIDPYAGASIGSSDKWLAGVLFGKKN